MILCMSSMTETNGWMEYTHKLEIIPGIPYFAVEMIFVNFFLERNVCPILSFFFKLFLIDLCLCIVVHYEFLTQTILKPSLII